MLPRDYTPELDFFKTQKGIRVVKETFEKKLSEKLSLQRVSAPIFLKTGTGLQDDLAGKQTPVSFKTGFVDVNIEIVQALTKWKRHALGKHGFRFGTGLITDMKAVRKDEEIDEIHSIFVDQWDWELVISKEQRTLEFLKEVVRKIYGSILEAEKVVEKEFPELKSKLPKEIKFIHTEELEEIYPDLLPKEREDAIAKKYGAVFLIGIGHPLKSGEPHDLRAADYDDWWTETTDESMKDLKYLEDIIDKTRGLNGDIIVWDDVRKKSMELTSMGIRVDEKSLVKQLEMMGLTEKKELEYHRGIIESRLPLTIGGGFGQSRLCMLLLQKAHIGEVQSSVWSEEVEKEFEVTGIPLL
ncbi:MAG: aspartate--ammonia ligase [Candidatus Aenigmarchaeota archaeon]|nr:aspartate--ammonia ligase [Candidatus Aenigmarchaeota archaeon]